MESIWRDRWMNEVKLEGKLENKQEIGRKILLKNMPDAACKNYWQL